MSPQRLHVIHHIGEKYSPTLYENINTNRLYFTLVKGKLSKISKSSFKRSQYQFPFNSNNKRFGLPKQKGNIQISSNINNHVRYFSYRSLNQLLINSTYDNIVFTDGKAVLMLPSLKYHVSLIKHYTKRGKNINKNIYKDIWENENFFISLWRIITQLEPGTYFFDLHFYTADFNNYLNWNTSVYIPDVLNKDCFILVPGSFGYTNLIFTFLDINEHDIDKLLIQERFFYWINKDLKKIAENDLSKDIIDFNKNTLVVITKLNK